MSLGKGMVVLRNRLTSQTTVQTPESELWVSVLISIAEDLRKNRHVRECQVCLLPEHFDVRCDLVGLEPESTRRALLDFVRVCKEQGFTGR